MARNTDKQAQFKKVIQLPLEPEEVAQVVGWDIEAKDALDTIGLLCENGYSVSCSYDATAEQWSVSVNGKYARCPNAGFLIYGNGADFFSALKSALFKATVKADGENWEILDEQPNENILW